LVLKITCDSTLPLDHPESPSIDFRRNLMPLTTEQANGPEWDGKVEPRLLGKEVSNTNNSGHLPRALRSLSSFDHSSNITNYAFVNEDDKVKIYVDLPDVEVEYPNEENVQLEFTKQSFALSLWKVNSFNDTEELLGSQQSRMMCDKRLAFSKLFAPIESASLKRRKGKIVLTLVKSENTDWSSIGAK